MDFEPTYDERIAPLMAQIIDICKNHGIPMCATFQLTDEEDPLYCSTSIPGRGASERMKALQIRLARDVRE